jgi:hypothetical protein
MAVAVRNDQIFNFDTDHDEIYPIPYVTINNVHIFDDDSLGKPR